MQQTSPGDAHKSLPTGTVTFLFSDIEGSTERWDKHREAMQEALTRHDALLRSVIEVHGGHVFKTIGDAFCAVFQTAPEAIAAALAVQRGIASEDWSSVHGLSVRMAVHTGHAYDRDGDYFGPAVNRVARLLAIGHGGQVLVSGVATELAQGQMPSQATLRDLGAHRLRDLSHPEQVYQLVAPELAADFPPLRSLDALPNNLPLQVTSFVGRDRELAEIKALLGKSRLVSLVGSGGVGKTRIALQVGADLLDSYPDGVWLVELGALSDASLVQGAVASAVGVKESAGRPLFETLLAYLRSRRALVLLDNCEHVVTAAARVADELIRGCAGVSVLATGREALGIAGEAVMRLPSLAVPDHISGISAHEAQQYGGVALFVDRATAVVNSFALSDENAPFVAEICQRLDGIALAIELAAARVRLLNPADLAKRLDERFRLLTGGSRTALPRQQTMRALMDWSYDLLTREEQIIFRRLSIFAGGWTLEAASTVCADETIESFAVLDYLSALVDKSLVVVDFDERSQRYRLLETTREYALQRLDESGGRLSLAAAHAHYFLEIAERSERTWSVTPTRAWSAMLAPEVDNFRVALGWLLEQRHDVNLGLRLSGSLLWYWADLAPAEGRRWLRTAMSLIDEETPPDIVAKLWLAQALIERSYTQRKNIVAAGRQAIRCYEKLDDTLRLAEAKLLTGHGLIFIEPGPEGAQLLNEALEIFRKTGEARLAALCILELGNAADMVGDTERGRGLLREAYSLLQAQGSEREAAIAATDLAETEFESGNYAAALAANADALAIQRSLGHFARMSISLHNRAVYLFTLGKSEEALAVARESLVLARDLQAEVFVAYTVQTFAAISAAREDFNMAAKFVGFCDAYLAELGVGREYTEQQLYDTLMPLLKSKLPAERLQACLSEGSLWGPEQAVAQALEV
ncbi:MAG: adenylate/guanylate cyclase domain-containing protein [Candidatus Eremiobacter antarcticus]|nr:adenylate/guanylate cyclase domain-containing protein [Candidatus Eremiobacteraeota bacterium]MBC5807471.1 adenylate/guanylate cyclase domain-containing protein [Candidatus Eremiobacteraeota bacterium]PZR61469.1 MAG: adenylate/guanylate cyclase domain-containing protein [Candidatus Eremiobacter sp. RRmetagenome_bin22]